MNVKKLVGLLAVGLLVYFVVVKPADAATSVHNVGFWLKNAADSFTTFFSSLV